ncbi:MAG: hypothetical protein IPJ32_20930 [Sphingobacteriaceae bacterium]|nr:hypothetical protein [Sphingobacteriaceae bacterium]
MTEKDKIVSEERQVKPLGLNYYTAIKDNSVSVLDLSHARVIPEFMRVIYKMKHKFGHTNIILDFSSVNMVLPGPLVSISACIEFFKTQGLSFEIRVHNSYLLGTSFYSPEIPVENPTNSFLDKVWKFSESKHVYKIVDGLIESKKETSSIKCLYCRYGSWFIADP